MSEDIQVMIKLKFHKLRAVVSKCSLQYDAVILEC